MPNVFEKNGVWTPSGPVKSVDTKIGKGHRGLRPQYVYGLPSGARLVASTGRIVLFQGDAIVNAASEDCLTGEELDSDISAAGGPELHAARRALPRVPGSDNSGDGKRCRRGSAVVTVGGKLRAKWCIHAVGPDFKSAGEDPSTLAACDGELFSAYGAALSVAKHTSFKTVAFAPISASETFRGARSLQRVMDLAVDGIADADYKGLEEVHVVASNDDQIAALLQAFVKHQQGFRALEHGDDTTPDTFAEKKSSSSPRRATAAGPARVADLKRFAGPARSSSLSVNGTAKQSAKFGIHRSASANLGSVLSPRTEKSVHFQANLLVELQKRKGGSWYATGYYLRSRAADIQFRNEGVKRAVEILTNIKDPQRLTDLKFLVDDLGTPTSCNMLNLMYKFLPDDGEAQKQVFKHFSSVAMGIKAAQDGARRLWEQSKGMSPRSKAAKSLQLGLEAEDLSDNSSPGSDTSSPQSPSSSSPKLSLEIVGERVLQDVENVVADLKASLGPLRPVKKPNQFDKRRRIILSDIDDTLYQSMTGGRKWPTKITIPGLQPLFRELTRGRGGGTDGADGSRLHFISARPRELAGHTLRKLGPNGFGFRNIQMHTGRKQDLLLLPFNLKGAYAQIAAKKFKHFTKLHRIYPECEYFWFGDSGQGDIEMGASMLNLHSKSIGGVYIHDVFGGDNSTPKSPRATRAAKQELGIHITDTYVAAAIDAYCRGKLSVDSLRRMVHSTVEELVQVCETNPRQMYFHTLRLCCRDLIRANQYLTAAGRQEVDLYHLLVFLAKVSPSSSRSSGGKRRVLL